MLHCPAQLTVKQLPTRDTRYATDRIETSDAIFLGYSGLSELLIYRSNSVFPDFSITGYLHRLASWTEEAYPPPLRLGGIRSVNVPELAVPQHGSVAGEISIEDWLAGNDRVLLIGEAGSGKSTLLQWLAVRAARGDFEGDLRRWNHYIPFFIPLRRYASGGPPPPEAFPASVGKNIIDSMPKPQSTGHSGLMPACQNEKVPSELG
jgi:hypothetical protein